MPTVEDFYERLRQDILRSAYGVSILISVYGAIFIELLGKRLYTLFISMERVGANIFIIISAVKRI